MDYSKFENKFPYPSTKHGIEKPDKKYYPNHEYHGKAMDEYEAKIKHFRSIREDKLAEYQKEESKQLQLFYDEIFDEMDWDRFTEKQKSAIRIHLWSNGHAEGFSSIHNEAYALEDLLNHF